MSRLPRGAGESRKRRVLFAAGSLLATLAIVIALVALYARPLLAGPALTRLVITGTLKHVSPQAVRAAVRAELGSGFFNTNVSAVRTAVAALPWVETASVRRSWPHTLYIEIREETPVARWNDAGLMDAQGRVFVRAGGQDWTRLPQFFGPDDSAATVLNEYRSYAALLASKGLTIRQMHLDARGSATLSLSDGISVRLGRQQAERRLERFATVALQTLAGRLTQVAYVDMRYANGFAVGYMPPCRWQGGAGGKRRARDGAAGQPTMDGSRSCGAACVAVGQQGGAGGKRRAGDGAAGQPTMDDSQDCGAPCITAGKRLAKENPGDSCSTPFTGSLRNDEVRSNG